MYTKAPICIFFTSYINYIWKNVNILSSSTNSLNENLNDDLVTVALATSAPESYILPIMSSYVPKLNLGVLTT